MPSIFITAANRFNYAIGSTQTVSDATAMELLAVGVAELSDTVQLEARTPTWLSNFYNFIQSWVAGAFCALAGTQTISGTKTFTAALTTIGALKVTSNMLATFTDSSSTPGNVTNSTPRGRVAVAAGANTVTVTSTIVTANSTVLAQVTSTDATLNTVLQVVPGAGTFTITCNAAATAATKVDFIVIN